MTLVGGEGGGGGLLGHRGGGESGARLGREGLGGVWEGGRGRGRG